MPVVMVFCISFLSNTDDRANKFARERRSYGGTECKLIEDLFKKMRNEKKGKCFREIRPGQEGRPSPQFVLFIYKVSYCAFEKCN